MLDCSHFRTFVDPCNICAILVRRSFPAGSCAEKTTAVLCRSPHGILPKRNPCTPRCFRAKRCPVPKSGLQKKTVKKQEFPEVVEKPKRVKEWPHLVLTSEKLFPKLGAGKERRRQILSPVIFSAQCWCNIFFVHRSFTRWFREVQVTFFKTKLFVGFHFCTRVFGG